MRACVRACVRAFICVVVGEECVAVRKVDSAKQNCDCTDLGEYSE